MHDYILTSDTEKEVTESSKKEDKQKNKDKYWNGDNNDIETKVVDNHIYYYCSDLKGNFT